MQLTLPSVNQPIWTTWSENDRNMYARLPYYLAKSQYEYKKTWAIFSKILGNRDWKTNSGEVGRLVVPTPSPHVRQFIFPNAITALPNKDVMVTRERQVPFSIRSHCFESPIFEWSASFLDFLNDKIDRNMKDIVEKQTRAEEIFYRGHIFHQAPYVFLPDRASSGMASDVVGAPSGDGNDAGTSGKTNAWLAANLPQIGSPGNLSLNALNLALGFMETDQRLSPFSGSGMPQGDNAALDGKYLLICSGEAYNQFIYDHWLLQHKNCDLDVVNQGFKANLFGRITTRLEDLPLRIAIADDGSVTFPEPEATVLDGENAGEPMLTEEYKSAAYEVAWLVAGGESYDKVRVGPPPKYFGGNIAPEGFGNLNWNGEVIITKDILIYFNNGGTLVQDTNKYGRWLQLISQTTYGIVGVQKRAILPIIFKRHRGATQPVTPV